MIPNDRATALAEIQERVNKRFGTGALMAGDGDALSDVEAFSSGSLTLDAALGVGGWPRGRIVEIYGAESSGKTTLALTAIAQVQAQGGVAVFIDAEHALDPAWARKIGVQWNDQLRINQPDCGEQALEIADMLVASGLVDLVVIDSVAALTPRAELEGEMSDQQVGLQARMMSKAMRKMAASVANTSTTVIFINQLRDKINGFGFGDPTTTSGGKALKYFSTVRVDVRRIGSVKQGDTAIGNQVRAKITKNKVAPPFRIGEFEILFDEGISSSSEVLDLGVKNKLVTKSGAWYSIGDERIGQGKEAARSWLLEHPDQMQRITDELRVILFGTPTPTVSVSQIENNTPGGVDIETGEILDDGLDLPDPFTANA